VIGALLAGDESLDDIAAVLRHITPPPGRMQMLGGDQQPLVLVDYAHTPDALEKALGAARDAGNGRRGRVICVFGCGGDRDPGKRPQMGAVAERLADRVIVTSDNPRSENPADIIDAIVSGMKQEADIVSDRATAIAQAIAAAHAHDVILLAGKGHEPYQEIAGIKHPFSDLDLAKSALVGRRL
jgi:UDP-N-acetylmuramoyl-L-alanyl-D-glutamate--2,6-diaminopimelate ligase